MNSWLNFNLNRRQQSRCPSKSNHSKLLKLRKRVSAGLLAGFMVFSWMDITGK